MCMRSLFSQAKRLPRHCGCTGHSSNACFKTSSGCIYKAARSVWYAWWRNDAAPLWRGHQRRSVRAVSSILLCAAALSRRFTGGAYIALLDGGSVMDLGGAGGGIHAGLGETYDMDLHHVSLDYRGEQRRTG